MLFLETGNVALIGQHTSWNPIFMLYKTPEALKSKQTRKESSLSIPSTGKSTHNEEVELWRKPECSWAKLNFDAGFNDDLRSGS
jgi:hypothetical protein